MRFFADFDKFSAVARSVTTVVYGYASSHEFNAGYYISSKDESAALPKPPALRCSRDVQPWQATLEK